MFKVGYNTKRYRLDDKSYTWENLFIKSNQSILWNQIVTVSVDWKKSKIPHLIIKPYLEKKPNKPYLEPRSNEVMI